MALELSLVVASPAFAYIGNPKSAGVTKGEVSIEYKASRLGDDRKFENNDQKHEFEGYYGITDRLKLGVEHVVENEPQEDWETETNILNATYNTTKQDEGWWLSSAVFGGYGFEDGDPDTIGLVLIAERDQGPFNVKANLGFKREVGGGRSGGVEYDTALQLKYNWLKSISPALEWHADYGSLNNSAPLDQQGHYVGPYLSGRAWEMAQGQVKWGAGYFWGLTDASADNAQRVLLEYEFRL